MSALFFFHNYAISSTCWAIEHFWSLSVEEQFYLIWPVLLILCLRLPGTDWQGIAPQLMAGAGDRTVAADSHPQLSHP